MEAPLREIVTHCGEEPSVVLNQVKQGTGSYGYNAATGEYGDLVAMGILDPTKVLLVGFANPEPRSPYGSLSLCQDRVDCVPSELLASLNVKLVSVR